MIYAEYISSIMKLQFDQEFKQGYLIPIRREVKLNYKRLYL